MPLYAISFRMRDRTDPGVAEISWGIAEEMYGLMSVVLRCHIILIESNGVGMTIVKSFRVREGGGGPFKSLPEFIFEKEMLTMKFDIEDDFECFGSH